MVGTILPSTSVRAMPDSRSCDRAMITTWSPGVNSRRPIALGAGEACANRATRTISPLPSFSASSDGALTSTNGVVQMSLLPVRSEAYVIRIERMNGGNDGGRSFDLYRVATRRGGGGLWVVVRASRVALQGLGGGVGE